MTISREERVEWRNEAKTKNATEHRDGVRLLIALNALEAAEARAEAAERERDLLATVLGDGEGNECPYAEYGDVWAMAKCRPDWCVCTDNEESGFECTENGKDCWLEWARQQARGGEI